MGRNKRGQAVIVFYYIDFFLDSKGLRKKITSEIMFKCGWKYLEKIFIIAFPLLHYALIDVTIYHIL